MWINQSGPFSDHMQMIGSMAFPCYTVEGEKRVLFDAGITSLMPFFPSHFGEGKFKPDFVALTHSHYDHVGGIGILRHLARGIQTIASEEMAQVLSKPKVFQFILDMNRKEENLNQVSALVGDGVIPLGPEDVKVDRIVADGERIELGRGVTLEAILAPGHTKDSTCYLVRPDGVLIGGEALGSYISADEVQPQFTSGFADYIASLKKLGKLDVQALALPHHGVLTGKDAKSHFDTAIRCAEEFRLEVLGLLGEGMSPEAIAQTLSAKLRHGLAAMQPERAFAINLQAMIRVVAREGEGVA